MTQKGHGMTAESQSDQATAEEARGRSTIEFPYFDQASGIEVAHAVKQVGGTSCEIKQLAVKMNMAADGGGFRTRLMSAKTFGLIDYKGGQVELTELGIRVVDPQYERAARLDSFMTVPLYKALFDKLNGQTLPPPAAVERMAEHLGVAPKQKDKARQTFMRSAKTAGLFELSSERLSIPPSLNGGPTKRVTGDGDDSGKVKNSGGSGGGGGDGGQYHPFIQGLLQKLPPPDTEWPVEARKRWLATAANIFGLMYTQPESDIGIVEVQVSKL
jgi:hypothetical protein